MSVMARRARPVPVRAPKKSVKPATRDGLSDEAIHREVSAAIIDHRIPPGTALQEDALAMAFAVSRTVIRKVLQRLSHEKLVDLVPNKGASVAKPSAEEARQVFDARRVVERVLIERAVANVSDEELAGLAQLVTAEHAAFDAGDKYERLRLSGDFHRRLAALAGNDVLSGFLNELISRTSLIIALYESPGAVPCSHAEHAEIMGAMKRRDAKRAAQYMDHHLRHIEAQIELSANHAPVDFKSMFAASSN
jgi:DNA-binding GntR family transcriptional regulator